MIDPPRQRLVAGVRELAVMGVRRRRGWDEVEAHQAERLRVVLDAAVAHVPAYRRWYEGLDVAAVRSTADLPALPLTDKRAFLAFPEDDRRWTSAAGRCRMVLTSGTSGEPFRMAWPPWASWRGGVQRVWMMRAMRAPFLGVHLSLNAGIRAGHRPRRPGVLGLIDRRRGVLADDRPLDELVDELVDRDVDWVSGQPHVLLVVGEAAAGRLRPKLVTTHGSVTDDHLRAALREAWGSTPLDIYGTAEHGQVAWQCRAADLYHLNHETAVIEVVDDEGRPAPAGTAGRLVLTTLVNVVQPMIRYDIGDVGAMATRPCACGDTLPALEQLHGRLLDWIIDAAGRPVPPQRLWAAAAVPNAIGHARRYRVRQSADRRVTVEVVPAPGWHDGLAREWIESYRSILGEAIAVEVAIVDALDDPAGRRFRQFTSDARPG
jgi:phenylacetate-CoA ligase